MKDEDRNKTKGFGSFRRYFGNHLGGTEKNAFERELQKDPFAAEAAEGFSLVDPQTIEKDITELEKRLEVRTAGRNKRLYLRIAATIVILLSVTGIIIIQQSGRQEQLAVGEKPAAAPLEISKTEPLNEKTAASDMGKNPEIETPSIKDEITVSGNRTEEAKGYTGGIAANVISRTEVADTITLKPVGEMMAAENISEKIAAPVREIEAYDRAVKKEAITVGLIRGKVISAEDNLPIPGATVVLQGKVAGVMTDTQGNFEIKADKNAGTLLSVNYIGMKSKQVTLTTDSSAVITLEPDLFSLNEVAVVGYGVRRSEKTGAADKITLNEEIPSYNYTSPEPLTGKEAFNNYIDNNIKRPASAITGKVIVVISFKVNINGSRSDYKAVRSPAVEFTSEAIRLLKEGPDWKPATENNVPVSEEVRVRIVFK